MCVYKEWMPTLRAGWEVNPWDLALQGKLFIFVSVQFEITWC